MTHIPTASLSDRDLLTATALAADRERRTTADLLVLLAEVDTRKLYLGEGYASLFTYCTQALHLSEPAAYSRITAARTARRLPAILPLLTEGAVTLTTVGLLSAHLTDENHEALLDAARHKSKREVERLVALIDPQPSIPSSVRWLNAPSRASSPALLALGESSSAAQAVPAALEQSEQGPRLDPRSSDPPSGPIPVLTVTRPASRSLVAPLTPDRYLLKVTIGRDAHEKLERARALMRHVNPSGDPAAVIERALTVLLEQLEQRRLAAASRPRVQAFRTSRTRHVPAAIKRVVWARDDGRCAFVGSDGRCRETAFLEFHHLRPFAAGGATDADNLQLRCRPHNAHEAAGYFGETHMATARGGVVAESDDRA